MTMKKMLWILAAALLTLVTLGCGKINNEDDGDNTYTPISLSTKQSGYVTAGNSFAGRLIERVDAYAETEGDDNWFISPLSLQIDLGMLLNGAQGETVTELCNLLGYGAGETAEINAFSKLLLEKLPTIDKKTNVALANAIFYNKDEKIKKAYKDAVSSNYFAYLEALDFSKNSSAKTINDWCSKQTKGLVPKVIDEVDPGYMAFLINALYFKSEWANKFPKGSTSNESFTREDNATRQVKMMKLDGKKFEYGENDVCQSVRLPYGNGAYGMIVLLPKKGSTVRDIAAALGKEGRIPFGSEAEVDLWLPRFESKYHIRLNDVLEQMGMVRSFTGAADFQAMFDTPSHVDFVQQDTAIQVDEEGTEAAAVTVIATRKNGTGPAPKVVFHADHPFLYLITETSTGAVLFAGKFNG